MTKSRPGIPGAPKCINLIRNLQLNTSTMVKKNCSWILRPPTAERKCTGHKRSQSKHTGEFHQTYLSHTISHQQQPKDLNPNTQITKKRYKQHKTVDISTQTQLQLLNIVITSGESRLSHVYRIKSLQRTSPPIFTTSSSRSSRTQCAPLVSLLRRRAPLNYQCECSLLWDVVYVEVPPYYLSILQDKV